jgi:hypothetical protein
MGNSISSLALDQSHTENPFRDQVLAAIFGRPDFAEVDSIIMDFSGRGDNGDIEHVEVRLPPASVQTSDNDLISAPCPDDLLALLDGARARPGLPVYTERRHQTYEWALAELWWEIMLAQFPG